MSISAGSQLSIPRVAARVEAPTGLGPLFLMVFLFLSYSRITDMASAARTLVSTQFSWETVAQRFEEILVSSSSSE